MYKICAGELFVAKFHSFKAEIGNTISTLKRQKSMLIYDIRHIASYLMN